MKITTYVKLDSLLNSVVTAAVLLVNLSIQYISMEDLAEEIFKIMVQTRVDQ